MNKVFVGVGVVVLVGIVAVAYGAMQKQEMPAMEDAMMKDAMMDDAAATNTAAMEDNMMDDTTMDKNMMKDDAESMDKMDAMETSMKGSYEAYAPEKLARAEQGDVVLFFHASWCPSCRSASADIEKNLAAIPAGVSILKVDYDTSTEIKKQYGVTSQHTFVQVAADGALIKKWGGSPSLASLVTQIQ